MQWPGARCQDDLGVREWLKKQNLIGEISEAVGHQLAVAGFIARVRQIIDASIVSALVQYDRRQENEVIKQMQVPEDWNAAKREQKEVDARWTKTHGKIHYGYKLHANTDRRLGFIRQFEVTPASVNDTAVFESLLDPGNIRKNVYADRGYAKHARETSRMSQGYRATPAQRYGTAADQRSAEAPQPSHRQAARLWQAPFRPAGARGRQTLAQHRLGTSQRGGRIEGDRSQPDALGEAATPGRCARMRWEGRRKRRPERSITGRGPTNVGLRVKCFCDTLCHAADRTRAAIRGAHEQA